MIFRLISSANLIQGSSSIGKTTFCKQLADQVKENNPDLPVFFFTLEDSLRKMRAMSLSRLTFEIDHNNRIENRLIWKGGKYLSDDQIKTLRAVASELKKRYSNHYYLVASEPHINVKVIRDRVERKLTRIKKNTALIIVDYLQILPTPQNEKLSSLTEKIDFNLYELQCMARDLNGPVVLTSSTTKEDAKETDKKLRQGLFQGKGAFNILFIPRILIELLEGAQGDITKEFRNVELYVVKHSEGERFIDKPLLIFKYFYKYSIFKEPMAIKGL